VSVVHHTDGPNHVSFALPNGSGRAAVLDAIERGTKAILAWGPPDLVLYQAGADPYKEDPYSPLDLDEADLRERDRVVFAWAKAAGLPLAWVLAGGYTKDVSKVVGVHLGTFDAAAAVHG
jgi:acetoin utilization deacetylase AcuC-like enzyme